MYNFQVLLGSLVLRDQSLWPRCWLQVIGRHHQRKSPQWQTPPACLLCAGHHPNCCIHCISTIPIIIPALTSNLWITGVNSPAWGYMVVCYTSNSSQCGKTASPHLRTALGGCILLTLLLHTLMHKDPTMNTPHTQIRGKDSAEDRPFPYL